MDEWMRSGLIPEAIMLLIALEALLLLALRRFLGRGPAVRAWLPSLVAGFCLFLALRLALAGAPWPFLSLALVGALAGHLIDLFLRWRDA